MKSSDIAKVVFFHNTIGGSNRTTEQWIWEYKSNYLDLFVFTVAEDDNRIVGTQGMIPIYLNIKGKRCLSGKSESSLLDPAYRGGTLFQELYDLAMSLCKARNMQCVWGYTSAVKVWRHKLRFSVYENSLYDSILIVNLQSALSKIFESQWPIARRITLSLLAMGCYLYSFVFRFTLKFLKKPPKTNYSIEHQPRSMNDLGTFYGRLREKYPRLIHIDQDREYLTWRLFNNPSIKYQTYFVYEDGLLKGYCYVGTNGKDRKVVSLADFTFESAKAGAFLLRNLLDKWQNDKIGFVYFLGNTKNSLMKTMFDLLARFGFLKRRRSMSFILKNISCQDEDDLYDIKNWYASALWTEGYEL